MGTHKKGSIKHCNYCNAQFYVPKHRVNTAKFCNRACSNNSRKKDKKQKEYSINKKYNYYYVYKTINSINGKEYIGIHKTNNINDGYIGNGITSQHKADYRYENSKNPTAFCRAVVKYKYENFEKIILGFVNNYEELLEIEELIVTEEYVKDKNNYNITTGGKSPININQCKHFDITNKKGERYLGSNINKFCLDNQIESSGISKLIAKKVNSSQGFVRTEDYKDYPFYYIINIKKEKIYETDNILKWCKENQLDLLQSTGSTKLHKILQGVTSIINKEWWVCKKQDWKGYVPIDLSKQKNSKIFTLLDTNKAEVKVENIRKFCKKENIKPNNFYRFLEGKGSKTVPYTLLKVEFIYNNVNSEGTKIYITN